MLRATLFLLPALAMSLPAPLMAQGTSLASGAGPEIPWLRIVLSLLFCLALAAGAVLALRRYQARGGSASGSLLDRLKATAGDTRPRLAVIEARRLSPTAQVALVAWDGREMLLGVAEGSVTVLGERVAADTGEGAA